MRERTLILGGGGFIGTQLAARFQRSSARFSSLGHGLDDVLSDRLSQRRGSIEDSTLLGEMLSECSSVVYLACVTTPASSAREPGLEVTGNLLPLARFLESAQQLEPRPLIFVSSAGTVYGESVDDVAESAMLRPRSFYGAGKVAAEALLHAFAANSGWPTTILRPTNVYGPGQLPLKGFAVIPTIFRHMLERRVFEIWGDGSVVRDYLFIDDLCDLIARVIEQPPARFVVFNAGSGTGVSLHELLRLCEHVSGVSLQTRSCPARKVDVSRSVPSVDAVASAIGWRAETSLDRGLKRTWEWLLDQSPIRSS